VVENGQAHEIAAVFTFGREDLIPDMFVEIVGNLKAQFPEQLGLFAYYLERHIEVDGDLHGHLAERMVELLCGSDSEKWKGAAERSEQALRARINLWTAVMQAFEQRHSAPAIA
jgi:polyhydroxyalkanoate synthesis regulator protein